MISNPKVVHLIVLCITVITALGLCLGAWLTSKGYQGGEILLTTGASGLGGLIALLSSTRGNGPADVHVNNPPSDPVVVKETP